MRRSLFYAALAAATAVTGVVTIPAGAAPEPPPAQVQNSQASAVSAANAHVAANSAQFFLSADDEVRQVGVTSGGNGLQYVAYERTHHGLPVVGGDFVVVTNASNAVVNSSVAQSQVLNVGTTATVTAAQAALVSKTKLTPGASADAPRQVVLAWGTPKLAWETVVRGIAADEHGSHPSVLHVFVDATTGAVLNSYDEVRAGSGNGYYNGNVTIATSGSYSMTDTSRSGIKCGGQDGNAYTGPDDNWGNGGATNMETACVDVLYGVQKEWDMLSQWLGRNGINGSGGGFGARVALNDANAYWTGSNTTFGHNSANDRNLTAIDVVAHEYGHAIFQTTPGGAGSGNENGGLNEGTGDIFGAMTESFANNPNDPPDFLVGEEVNFSGNSPIRNMYNPAALNHPSCWSTSLPSSVHASAGPLNHWFYLVSEGSNPGGGKPTSPICSGGPSSVTGVGIQDAGKVYYNGLLAKTSSWRYANVRTATLNAAKNLYSDCRIFNTVKDAWNAVSVPAQTGDPTCTGQSNDFTVATDPASGSVAQGSTVSTTVKTTTSAGTAQNLTLSASNLPTGVTASFSPSSVTSGNNSTLTLTASASAPTGTYNVKVSAAGTVTKDANFALTVTGTGGGGCSGTNPNDVAITDNGTVTSDIAISGCSSTPSTTSTVPVKIAHTYKGDLVVDLVAPDGSVYNLHNRTGGGDDNIDQTYTVDLSSETANGTWKLRVQDAATQDTGTIDTWSLNLGGGQTTNDFSVTADPSSGSVAKGASVNSTIRTATTSGSAQNVALSASGLPSGVTASFSPTSVTSGNNSTLTLSAGSSAAAGTYNITVTGTGSVTRTASYSLTVTGGGNPPGIPDIDVAKVKAHLSQFSTIASQNGGNRRSTTAGYRASVAYVKGKLQDAGYTVTEQPCTSGCTSGAGPNLIAEWPGGDANNVYMYGAHLDSVSAGAGINDNASGSSALLETALVLAAQNPTMTNKVRFGWWTDEEQGLLGSKFYVSQLSSTERSKIKAYSNFDMVGSINGGYFINNINAAQSTHLKAYWDSLSISPEENTEGQGRSDDASFKNAGIPSTGYAAGASYQKTSAQATKWGGTASRAYDPCYHQSCDTTSNISDTILNRSADGIAYSIWKSAVGSTPANDFSVGTSPSSGSVAKGSSVNTTVSTTTVSGSAQNVSLSASGLPSGVTASFSPTSVTSGNSSTLTLSASASATAGTYNVTVTGTGSVTRTATYSLTVTGGSTGGCSGTNPDDTVIPDGGSVESNIAIANCSSAPSSSATVAVKINHTYIGDLIVSLIAPDGTAYVLHDRTGGSTQNIDRTYTVNVSSETANGTWKLKVQDVFTVDSGTIDTWTLNLVPSAGSGLSRTVR